MLHAIPNDHTAIFEARTFQKLQIDLAAHWKKKRNSRTEQHRMDLQTDLVNQVCLEKRIRQLPAPHHKDLPAFCVPPRRSRFSARIPSWQMMPPHLQGSNQSHGHCEQCSCRDCWQPRTLVFAIVTPSQSEIRSLLQRPNILSSYRKCSIILRNGTVCITWMKKPTSVSSRKECEYTKVRIITEEDANEGRCWSYFGAFHEC